MQYVNENTGQELIGRNDFARLGVREVERHRVVCARGEMLRRYGSLRRAHLPGT